MSDTFKVAKVNQPFIEAIGEDKVRFNVTSDRMISVQAIKGQPATILDALKFNGAATLLGLILGGIVKALAGAPSSESVTQTDPPKGKQWKDCTVKVSTNGKKSTYTRKLSEDEKLAAAIAHVELRVKVLYGEAELQSRTSNINPLGEELRKIVVTVSTNARSSLVDSDGVTWTVKTLPSVLCKSASSLQAIELAATSLGLGDKALAAMKTKAVENVERAKLDDILGDMDLSI